MAAAVASVASTLGGRGQAKQSERYLATILSQRAPPAMAPAGKRKHSALLDFDPNRSPSSDENYEPDADDSATRPARKKKKQPGSRAVKTPRRAPARGYEGSGVEDDEDDEESAESEYEAADARAAEYERAARENLTGATGRPIRRAAAKARGRNYRESSGSEVRDSQDVEEVIVQKSTKKTSVTPQRLVVKLEVNPQSLGSILASKKRPVPDPVGPRRSKRARTAESEGAGGTNADQELVALSNSGRRVLAVRQGSNDPSPVLANLSGRLTRGGKGPAKTNMDTIAEASQESSLDSALTTIPEATQESSSYAASGAGVEKAANSEIIARDIEHAEMESDEKPLLDQPDPEADGNSGDDEAPMATVEEAAGDDDEVHAADAHEEIVIAAAKEDVEDAAEEDDDVPVRRHSRRTRAKKVASADAEAHGYRLRRQPPRLKAKKKSYEQSSNYSPGDNSDREESESDKEREADEADAEDDEEESSGSRPRRENGGKRKGRVTRSSRQHQETDDEDDQLDPDEVAAEGAQLVLANKGGREKKRRREDAIAYERPSRNVKQVNYTINALGPVIEEHEQQQEATPPPKKRRRRGVARKEWDYVLHTTIGPFGGGFLSRRPSGLDSGPWGGLPAGNADSDSSDDELLPDTEGAKYGRRGDILIPPAAGAAAALDGDREAVPNSGKVKDQKSYADADPLGVDINVDFSKVGGLKDHVQKLKEMVQLPLLYPHIFKSLNVVPPRGVLFHGPPGTGKTLMARALANSGLGDGKKITFFMRKGADALSKWVGEAERQLRLLFEEARNQQPSIIFFDEIDGLAPVRSSKQDQIHSSIVSTLLALMDGMDGRGQVIVIGATNRPDSIDPALRRPGRFDREFYFPLPDVDDRKAIIDKHTSSWGGLSDDFKYALARETKGFAGADLRHLCTEAALNAIQRTYPQIYSSDKQLVVDASKVVVNMRDFSLSKKKITPSSERSSTAGAAPLPQALQPLLREQLTNITHAIDGVLPRPSKTTALDEAMLQPYDDEDFGFDREALLNEFQRSRVFRPRILVCGEAGMGQAYLGPAIRHHLEGVYVTSFDLSVLTGDTAQRAPEQVMRDLFAEVRRHKPAAIFIPQVDRWYQALIGPPMDAFLGLLKQILPTDPIMVMGIAECDRKDLPEMLVSDIFGYSSKSCYSIARPTKESRRAFFEPILGHIQRSPTKFPDPAHRKKRILAELPPAPPPPRKDVTRAEQARGWLEYRYMLHQMKRDLQPIMNEIRKTYQRFRNPVIDERDYGYLLDELDPDHVRPDVPNDSPRPYELATGPDGTQGIRDTRTGAFYYNLDIQTVEERLANGYYVKPLQFLQDIQALKHDAYLSGDRERMLKASEMMTNVETDVGDVNARFVGRGIDWDKLYAQEVTRRQAKAERKRQRRAERAEQAEKASREAAMLNQATCNVGDDQNGLTNATFQVMSPPPIDKAKPSASFRHETSHGTSHGTNGNTVPSQVSVNQPIGGSHTPLPPMHWPPMNLAPPGISTRASASGTAESSDPSARMGSNGGSKSGTNGSVHHPAAPMSSNSRANAPVAMRSTEPSMANILNDVLPSTSSQSQPVSSGGAGRAIREVQPDEAELVQFLDHMVTKTAACTIEQMEQVNREMMEVIWRTRGEHNRNMVSIWVQEAFAEVMDDIAQMQPLLDPMHENQQS